MNKPLTENEVRMLMRGLADEVDPAAPAPQRALSRAKRRLARNAVAAVLSLAVLAYGAVSIASRITPAPASVTGERGEADDSEIWIMDATGANQKRVTAGRGVDEDPAWSPDGKRIAFASNRAGSVAIWVLDLETGKSRRLTSDPGSEFAPAWTPDGKKIVFLSGGDGAGAGVIHVMNADGSDLQRTSIDAAAFAVMPNGRDVVFSCNDGGIEGRVQFPAPYSKICKDRLSSRIAGSTMPLMQSVVYETRQHVGGLTVSPDGRLISFRFLYGIPRVGGYGSDLAIVGVNGSGYRRLGNDPPYDEDPAWSPNGTIVYGRDGDIWVTLPDASNEARITFDPTAHDRQPAVDPTGGRVAFARVTDPPTQIYSMKADGTDVRRLTNIPAVNGGAVMSSDGRKIAFTSSRDGYAAVYVMDADGSNQVRLTNDTDGSLRPVWSPDGQHIAYLNRSAVWVMDADGSNKRRLPKPEGEPSWPTWSADGSLIAYQNDEDVYTVQPDGTETRRIASQAGSPTFGPPARLLAFVGHPEGSNVIQIVFNLGPGYQLGSGSRTLQTTSVRDADALDALWWGTGPEILFKSGAGISAVNPTTGTVRSITNGPANDYSPSWTPDGRILFNSDR